MLLLDELLTVYWMQKVFLNGKTLCIAELTIMANFLNVLSCFSGLDFESYECENPDMQEEKERYKYLK